MMQTNRRLAAAMIFSARQGPAAAFDEVEETRGLVGAVDIQGQIAGAIEIDHGDPVRFEQCFGGL